MRGFLEYDRTTDIETTYWHWYQDGLFPSGWDTYCGIISGGGTTKTSWFYLRTLMSEIGDKSFKESRVIARNGCKDLDTPSIHIANNKVFGNEPDVNCPRIYKYIGDCCVERVDENVIINSSENFANNVWTVWFPSMVNHGEEIKLYLVDDLNVIGEPTDYYTVEPIHGDFDGFKSDIFKVSTEPFTDLKYIEVKITEKPLFIHFLGECVCENDDPGNNPGTGCVHDVTTTNESKTCTFISFDLTLDIINCDLESMTPSITSINIGGFSSSSNSGYNTPQFAGNTASFEFVGLTPGTSYNFQIVIGYEIDGEFGVYTVNTSQLIKTGDPFTTNSANCFNEMSVDIATSTTYNCDGADINFDIEYSTADDADILYLNSSFVQLQNPNDDCESSSTSYPIPLGSVPGVNWGANQVQSGQSFSASATVFNLNPEECYCLSYSVTDELGNVYAEGNQNFCLEGPRCVVNVDPVGINTASCDAVCFSPSVNINGECATAYRLEIVDQDGNIGSKYVEVGPGFGDTCNPDDEFCFDSDVMEEILGSLSTPPFVGHIRSYTNLPGGQYTTNSYFFDIADCCEPRDILLDNIDYNISCYEEDQFAHFCLDVNDFATCLRNENGALGLDIDNISVTSRFDSDIESNGNNCFTVTINTGIQ